MSQFVVVGSLNMDLVVRSKRMPRPGETVFGRDFQTFPGGKGANQAVAAARLGARVRMVGRVGDDSFGHLLLDRLDAEGIDTRFVNVDSSTSTGIAVIILDETGQNRIIVAPGANWCLTAEDVESALSTLGSNDLLLMQLETPPSSVLASA